MYSAPAAHSAVRRGARISLKPRSVQLNPTSRKVLESIFAVVGLSSDAHSPTSAMFSGQQAFSRLQGEVETTWTLFLKHLAALASPRVRCLAVVTPCDSALDATGGEYRVDYKGVMQLIVEDTIAAFVEVGKQRGSER